MASSSSSSSKTYEPFKFLVLSDLHVQKGSGGRQYDKISRMKKVIKADDATKAVLLVGDLTDHGIKYHEDECDSFETRWYNPLTEALKPNGGKVYACLGNHDSPQKIGRIPDIVKFVKKNCGDPYYHSFDINGVHFAMCYLHPSHWDINISIGFSPSTFINSLVQMDVDLNSNKNKPTILAWHFPMEGPMGDWWFDWEKSLTKTVLKKYKNIRHIFVGHLHSPQFTTKWNKKYKVSYVGGSKFVVGSVNATGEITVTYMDKNGNTKTWDEMYRPIDDLIKSKPSKEETIEMESEINKPDPEEEPRDTISHQSVLKKYVKNSKKRHHK